MQYVKNIAN